MYIRLLLVVVDWDRLVRSLMEYWDQYQLVQVKLVIGLDQVQMVKQMFEVALVESIWVDHLKKKETLLMDQWRSVNRLPLSTIIAP